MSLLFLPVLSFLPAAASLFLKQGLESGESFLVVSAMSSVS